MKTKIKTVHGEDIWLEETTSYGVVTVAITVTLVLLFFGFFILAMITFSELLMQISLVCVVGMLFMLMLMLSGVLAQPVYSVFCYSNYSSNQTVPILNDGTDQARVCIAAKEVERQIIEDYNKARNLEKIAEGCK